MDYKCPLCLATLTPKQELERFCNIHPDEKSEVFKCTRENLRLKPFCRKCSEKNGEGIDEGVFLRHAGCPALNPFWDDTRQRVVVPGEPHKTTLEFELKFDGDTKQVVKVQHWLFLALRQVPATAKEMWFPLMMLRATGERRNGWRRAGVLVELVGSKQSGKTILAVQTTNRFGYPVDGANSDLSDYIYSRTNGAFAFGQYIETLHLCTSLRNERKEALFLPQGTPPDPGHLKVCFIKPPTAPDVDIFDGGNVLTNAKARLRQQGKELWRILKDKVLSANPYPFWHTIIFYDSSGEVAEEQHFQPAATDKVVIVVNAAELFRLVSSEESLRCARRRLEKGLIRRQKCYLVITQMDKAKSTLPDSEWQRMAEIADNLEVDWSYEAKSLLMGWLTEYSQQRGDHWEQLKVKLKRTEKVFFVWTEGLPTSYTPAQVTKMPVSHGLAKLVCACLGVSWNKLNQGGD